jgi:hypothetical protein
MGYVLSPERLLTAEAEPLNTVEGNTGCTVTRGAVALPGSETISRRKGTRWNLGDLAWPAVAAAIPGRDRESRRRSCRGTGEGSDEPIVPWKRSNKPVMNGGGERGGKGLSRREGRRHNMPRTQCRTRHAFGVACLRTGPAWATTPRTPVTLDLRQEPGAGKPHAGICAGGGEQSPSLPRPRARRRRRPRSVHSNRVGWAIEPRKTEVRRGRDRQ